MTPALKVRNQLLKLLPQEELAKLIAEAEHVELPLKQVLIRADETVGYVHFVESGTVSMISTLDDGTRVEVGIIGSEGMIGLSIVLGSPTSSLEGLVQVAGEAFRIRSAKLSSSLAETPRLGKLLLRYVDAFHSQVIQTAVCNSRHPIEQRLARWLLITHDRIEGDTFPMTHEFLSMMLGVRRQGITGAIGALRRDKIVIHVRGLMTVIDRRALEGLACQCYLNARKRLDWLQQPRK